MMSSFAKKMNTWRENDTLRGVTPWVMLLLAFYLVQSRVTYVKTNSAKTVAGFETGTMYLRQKGAKFCVGDMVRFLSLERRAGYYREVIADAGAVMTVEETGYRIDGAAVPMPAEWVEKARETMDGRSEISVPANHVLFVNPDVDAEKEYQNWAFETVPRKTVRERASHILLAPDLSRIGEPVGSTDPDCIR